MSLEDGLYVVGRVVEVSHHENFGCMAILKGGPAKGKSPMETHGAWLWYDVPDHVDGGYWVDTLLYKGEIFASSDDLPELAVGLLYQTGFVLDQLVL